jgi:hypothetical protein
LLPLELLRELLVSLQQTNDPAAPDADALFDDAGTPDAGSSERREPEHGAEEE